MEQRRVALNRGQLADGHRRADLVEAHAQPLDHVTSHGAERHLLVGHRLAAGPGVLEQGDDQPVGPFDGGPDALGVVRGVVVELIGRKVLEEHVDVRAELAQRLPQVVGDGGGEAVEVAVGFAQAAGVGEEVVVVARAGEGVADELGDRLHDLASRRREHDLFRPAVHDDAEELGALEQRQHGEGGPVDPLELLDEARECLAQLVEAGEEDGLAGADDVSRRRRVGEVDDAHRLGARGGTVVNDQLRPRLVQDQGSRVGGADKWSGNLGEDFDHVVHRGGAGEPAAELDQLGPGFGDRVDLHGPGQGRGLQRSGRFVSPRSTNESLRRGGPASSMSSIRARMRSNVIRVSRRASGAPMQ